MFLTPVRYGYLTVILFSTPFRSIHHARSLIVSIWFRMVVTQIMTLVCKDSLTMTYPPNINI
jgi:hypothetical protein